MNSQEKRDSIRQIVDKMCQHIKTIVDIDISLVEMPTVIKNYSGSNVDK